MDGIGEQNAERKAGGATAACDKGTLYPWQSDKWWTEELTVTDSCNDCHGTSSDQLRHGM
jgi:hypothetical protein